MYQYTTPLHTFILSIDLEELSDCKVIYAQQDRVLVTKTLEDAKEKTGRRLIIGLTQKETGKFDERFPAQVQLHAKTISGVVMASKIYTLAVDKLLDKEI